MSCHVMCCMWCDVMWCAVMWCDLMWSNVMWYHGMTRDVVRLRCDVVVRYGWLWGHVGDAVVCVVKWQMRCELRRTHNSKTLETSVPMRSETLWCKRRQDYGEPVSQYYDSVVQSITQYYYLFTPTYYKEYNVLQRTITSYKGLQSTGAFCSAQLCNVAIRHSRLIVTTDDTSSTLSWAAYGIQDVICLLYLPRKQWRSNYSSMSKQAIVADPSSRATWKISFFKSNQETKSVPKVLRLPRNPQNTTNRETQNTMERMRTNMTKSIPK